MAPRPFPYSSFVPGSESSSSNSTDSCGTFSGTTWSPFDRCIKIRGAGINQFTLRGWKWRAAMMEGWSLMHTDIHIWLMKRSITPREERMIHAEGPETPDSAVMNQSSYLSVFPLHNPCDQAPLLLLPPVISAFLSEVRVCFWSPVTSGCLIYWYCNDGSKSAQSDSWSFARMTWGCDVLWRNRFLFSSSSRNLVHRFLLIMGWAELPKKHLVIW